MVNLVDWTTDVVVGMIGPGNLIRSILLPRGERSERAPILMARSISNLRVQRCTVFEVLALRGYATAVAGAPGRFIGPRRRRDAAITR